MSRRARGAIMDHEYKTRTQVSGISLGDDHGKPRRRALHPPEGREPVTLGLDFVCDACNAVDWRRITKRSRYQEQVSLNHPLNSTSSELSASCCKVCQFLSKIKPPNDDGRKGQLAADPCPRDEYTHLQIAGGVSELFMDFRSQGEYFPNPSVMVIRSEQAVHAGLNLPLSIDSKTYEALRDLLRTCAETHHQTCDIVSKCSDTIASNSDSFIIPGLKVIHVSSRKVIEAPAHCQYLALSYVWGKCQHSADLRTPPAVVDDTLSVAAHLGLQYVWVDKHCVPSQEQERQNMIHRMGEIYSNAYCTVIAAAGEDAQAGLPGVSTRPRRQQNVSIKGVTLTCSPILDYHFLDLVQSSKWATRGWTFQECYLSKRRIFFTEDRVLYLCNKEFAPEPLENHVPQAGRGGTETFEAFIPSGPAEHQWNHRKRLNGHIEEYTRRELTFDDDSMDAFLGVLHFHISRSWLMIHLWGLPVYKLWRVGEGEPKFLFELLWRHDAPATRRREFPSWTWAGWAGPVKFCSYFLPGESVPFLPLRHRQRVRISVEDGEPKAFHEYAERALDRLRSCKPSISQLQLGPRRLLVSCNVLPVRIQDFRGVDADSKYIIRYKESRFRRDDFDEEARKTMYSGGPLAVFQAFHGVYAAVKPYFDHQMEESNGIFGLYFPPEPSTLFVENDSYFGYRHLLLVRRVGDDYERVGFVEWKFLLGDIPMLFVDGNDKMLDFVTLPDEDDIVYIVSEEKTICLV